MAESQIKLTQKLYVQEHVISPLDTQPKVALSFEPGPQFKPIQEVEEEEAASEVEEDVLQMFDQLA